MVAARCLRITARRLLSAAAPAQPAWRGAALGIAIASLVVLVAAGLAFASGRGGVFDALSGVALGSFLVLALAVALIAVGTVLRRIPLIVRALGLAAIVVVSLPFSFSAGQTAALLVAAVLVALAALTGASVVSLSRRQAGRLVPGLGLAIAVSGLLAVGAWLSDAGEFFDAGDPAPAGPFEVATITYGSGTHPWRTEFGSDVDIPTRTVNGSRLLTSWQGLAGSMRSEFWGFGPGELPLNATVWYPDSEGPFPLVLVLHGNARMELPSDTGYAWLAEELASWGYVVASVDQNFLNSSITRLDLEGETAARAWLLLEHLRLWREWQGDSGSRLYGLADLERIALIGQSRAGEAVAIAAFLDKLGRYPEDASVELSADLGIQAVVAIAPNDGLYRPAGHQPALTDTSYLVIHGGMDGDVDSFAGLRQYQRARFSGERYGLRSAVYLPGANHGQFNTEWGRFDAIGPASMLLDTAALMPPNEQRAAGRLAIMAFLSATLQGDSRQLDVLEDPLHPAWPPSARPILRFADSSQTQIASFDEDADPATGTLPGTRMEGHGLTVWRELPLPLHAGHQGTNAAVLGWSRPPGGDAPWLSIRLPDDWVAPPRPILLLSAADSGRPPPGEAGAAIEPADLTVVLVDAAGASRQARLSELGGVPLAQRSSLLKRPLGQRHESIEAVARTFRIELDAPGFDASRLREIRLLFDQTEAGLIYVDEVSIAAGR